MVVDPQEPADPRAAVVEAPLTLGGGRPSLLAPGVEERLTYRCYLHFGPARYPTIAPPSTTWTTVIEREVAYSLLRSLEVLRRWVRAEKDSEAVAELSARRFYRYLRSSLARSLLLPTSRFVLRSGKSGPESGRNWLEASRRVFDLEGALLETKEEVVCHVFTFHCGSATDRLLLEFVDAARHGQVVRQVYDAESRLFLWAHSGLRLAGRRYYEILIAPPSALSDDEATLSELEDLSRGGGMVSRQVTHGESILTVGGMDAKSTELDADSAQREALTVESGTSDVIGGFNEELYAQARYDWAFVIGRIDKAVEVGRALDDAFIADVARKRPRHAQGVHTSASQSVAGPTFESSVQIVRDIVELHNLATQTDELPSGDSIQSEDGDASI